MSTSVAEMMANIRARHNAAYRSTPTKRKATAAPEMGRPVKRFRANFEGSSAAPVRSYVPAVEVIAAPVTSTVPADQVQSRKRKASAIEDDEVKPEDTKKPRISSAESMKRDSPMMGGQKPIAAKSRKISGGRERKPKRVEVKVPSPEDEEAVKPTGAKESKPSAAQTAKPDGTKSDRVFDGIINHENNCFLSSIIQLMDADFDGSKIDELLGDIDNSISIELPELTLMDVEKSGVKGAKKMQKLAESKLGVLKAEVKTKVDAAQRARDLDTISIAKHLRNLLEDLRSESGDTDKHTRRNMTGATQQDCFELYTLLLDVLEQDKLTKDAAGVMKSFAVEEQVTPVCKSCNHKGDSRKVPSNFIDVAVPNKGPADLAELLRKTDDSELEMKCSNCSHAAQHQVSTYSKLPDNLVIRLNRVDWMTGSKINTIVELPSELEFSQPHKMKYRLDAVVRHKGISSNAGHYFVDRRRACAGVKNGESEWVRIDDDVVCDATEAMRQNGHKGQAVMVLYKIVSEEA
ncbi:hypothetical protein B0A48_13304 [Cryoendolithus antarcticus]|uniref:USP domain-containing protein n=1 Tax=Cryoendolithus antarcticus TaxID=1507870 RepID=A0A1V8SPY2_9PEZI|nr:hypothetical protein B0A48_13304 [Cryoendolithus antarcticus]